MEGIVLFHPQKFFFIWRNFFTPPRRDIDFLRDTGAHFRSYDNKFIRSFSGAILFKWP